MEATGCSKSGGHSTTFFRDVRRKGNEKRDIVFMNNVEPEEVDLGAASPPIGVSLLERIILAIVGKYQL